jgi:predicted metal-binding membrane protein
MVEAAGSTELLQRLPAPAVSATFGLLDSLLIAAMVAGGLAGALLASITGTRWSLAALAISATTWTLRAQQAGLPAATPPDLRSAVLEGAAR